MSRHHIFWLCCLLLCESPLSSASPRLRQRRLQEETAFDVHLFLALLYVDEELAQPLEATDGEHEVVQHFCRSVTTQASGTQVSYLAQVKGVSVTTQVNECSIQATNRAYDNDAADLLGPEFFILEVSVLQTVYVTANDDLWSLEDVQELVLAGFESGIGGRVKFRSLLKQDFRFSSILDTQVLDDGLSPPQDPPTLAPTTPTAAPSTVAPTEAPTLPIFTTFAPSPTPTDSSNNGKRISKRQALIIAAIVGGVATILVSCFFIFCVWMPLFSNEEEERREGPRAGARKQPLRLPSGQGARLAPADSFDDSSLYTSGFSVVDVAPKSSNNNTEQVESSYKERITIISSANGNDETKKIQVIPEERAVAGPVDLDMSVASSDESLVSNEQSVDSFVHLVDMVESDEEMARQVSEKLSLGTKGYDPFDADPDSSCSLGDASSDEGAVLPVPRDGDLSADEFFDEAMGSFHADAAPLLLGGLSDESSKEVDLIESFFEPDDDIRDAAEGAHDDSISDMSQSDIFSDPKQANNDALLRNVLESARIMSTDKPGRSNQSAISRKSAPQLRSRPETQVLTSADLLVDTLDLRDYQSKPPVHGKKSHRPSLSVGGMPLNTPLPLRGRPSERRSSSSIASRSPSPSLSRQQSTGSRDTTLLAGNTNNKMTISEGKESPASSKTDELGIRESPALVSCSGSEETPNPWLVEDLVDSPSISIPPDADLDSAGATPTLQPRRPSDSIAEVLDTDLSSHPAPTQAGMLETFPEDATGGDPMELGCFPEFSAEEETKVEAHNSVETAPRSLEDNLKRFEARLAEVMTTPDTKTTSSSVTSCSTSSARKRIKHRIVVVAPPGKVGIVLANRNDGRGTVVSQVRPSSSVIGLLSPGDKLIAVDDQDVTDMKVKEITSLMTSTSDYERRLTILTANVSAGPATPEAKEQH